MLTSFKTRNKILTLIIFPIFLLGNLCVANLFNNNNQNKSIYDYSSKVEYNYSFEEIESGAQFSGGIVNDGTTDHLYTWGDNLNGQLGLGNTKNQPTPTEVTFKGLSSPIDIEKISFGVFHSAAIINDGDSDHLYTWGENEYGQLGLGDEVEKQYDTPQEVITGLPSGSEIEQISMGDNHSAAVVNDGESDQLYTWGKNDKGQLGLGNTAKKSTPTKVTALPDGDIKQIVMSQNFSAAIVNDNDEDHLYTWGENDKGQLGLGDIGDQSTPTKVTALPAGDIKQISLSEESAGVVVSPDNASSSDKPDELWMWGDNEYGQLGLGTFGGEVKIPKEVTALKEDYIKEISLGGYSSFAVVYDDNEIDNKLYGWGSNQYSDGFKNCSQLGLGSGKNDKYDSPQLVDTFPTPPYSNNITKIFSGTYHSGVIIEDESNQFFYTWGLNASGQLGQGTKTNTEKPQLVEVSSINNDSNPKFIGSPEASEITKTSTTITFTYSYGKKGSNTYDDLTKLTIKDKNDSTNTWIFEQADGTINEIDKGLEWKESSIELDDLDPNTPYSLILTGEFSSSANHELDPIPGVSSSSVEFKTRKNGHNSWYYNNWYYLVLAIFVVMILFIIFSIWFVKKQETKISNE